MVEVKPSQKMKEIITKNCDMPFAISEFYWQMLFYWNYATIEIKIPPTATLRVLQRLWSLIKHAEFAEGKQSIDFQGTTWNRQRKSWLKVFAICQTISVFCKAVLLVCVQPTISSDTIAVKSVILSKKNHHYKCEGDEGRRQCGSNSLFTVLNIYYLRNSE